MSVLRRPAKARLYLPWGVALVMALLVSGLPHAIASVAHGGETACQVACPDADDSKTCPPLCSQGTCGKVAPATVAAATPAADVSPVVDDRTAALRTDAVVSPDEFEDSVFHPPRA